MTLAKPILPRLQRGHPLARGLIAAWTFHEGSGPSLVDISGRGNTGTLQNAPSWSGGQFGSSLSFNAASSQSVLTTNTALSNDFTFLVWFRPTATAAFTRIADKNYIAGFWLGHAGSGSGMWGGGVIEYGSSYGIFVPLATNEWHQLVSRRSGTTHTIIGDGGAVSTSNIVASTALDATAVRFGVAHNGSGYFSGQISQVLFWNRAVSDADIKALYLDPFAMFRPRRVLKLSAVTAHPYSYGFIFS